MDHSTKERHAEVAETVDFVKTCMRVLDVIIDRDQLKAQYEEADKNMQRTQELRNILKDQGEYIGDEERETERKIGMYSLEKFDLQSKIDMRNALIGSTTASNTIDQAVAALLQLKSYLRR